MSAKYGQVLTTKRQHGFSLKPVVLTEGIYKGKRVLLVEEEKPFRFFDLPPELRNRVYDLVLDEPNGEIEMSSYKPRRKDRHPVRRDWFRRRNDFGTRDVVTEKLRGPRSSAMTILQVCKQMK